MHARHRAVLAGLAAALMLASVVSSASGNRLSITEPLYRISWSSLEFIGTGTVRCNVTIIGSFHSRSITKSAGSLVGNLFRVTLGTCSGGTVTVLTETLPWHVTYERFAGTLPSIERVFVSVTGVSLRVSPTELFACLLRSTTESPVKGWFQRSGSLITSFAFDSRAAIPLAREGLCPLLESEHLGGSGTASGALTNRLFLSLI